MVYVVIIIVVVVGGASFLGLYHVRQASSPGDRPSMEAARRVVRQSRILASGGLCMCGGALEDSGAASARYGALMSCPDCGRAWTKDGRSIVRRRRALRR